MANPYYWSAHWRALRAEALLRDGGCCTAPGCRLPAILVDHIRTRPPVTYPTAVDRLDNLRCLCRAHDNQVKETRVGSVGYRRRGGVLAAKGVAADGWPLGS